MKKRLMTTALTVVTASSLMLAGCGSKTETATTSAKPAESKAPVAAESKKDVTVTVAASQNWIKDIDRKLADEFTKQSGIKIDFQVNPDDQYMNVVKTKLSTHEAPDVIYLPSGIGMADFQPDKNLLDLSNEPWAGKLKDWAKNGATVKGKLYALNTWSVDGWGLLYNPEVFAANGLTVPKTYDELVKVSDALLAKGITPIYENGKDEWHLPLWLSGVATEANKQVAGLDDKLNDDTMKFADIPVLEKAMTQLNEMNKKGYFGKNVLSNDWDHSYEALGTGKYAMGLVYTTYQQEIAQKYPNSGAEKWKMFPIPLGDNKGFATNSGGIVRGINKESKNIDAVKQYFAFLTKDENLTKYYVDRKDVGEPSFKGITGNPPTAALKSILETPGVNLAQAFEVSIKFWDGGLVGKSLQDMISGAATPKQVLQKLDDSRAKSFKVAK